MATAILNQTTDPEKQVQSVVGSLFHESAPAAAAPEAQVKAVPAVQADQEGKQEYIEVQ
jgi:hypothetical protein